MRSQKSPCVSHTQKFLKILKQTEQPEQESEKNRIFVYTNNIRDQKHTHTHTQTKRLEHQLIPTLILNSLYTYQNFPQQKETEREREKTNEPKKKRNGVNG